MGCVPDRALNNYRTFTNDAQQAGRQGQLAALNRNSRLSLNSNDLSISYRPFAKVYRSNSKRHTNQPVMLTPQLRAERRKPNYFSLQKTKWNNMEEQIVVIKRETNTKKGRRCHVKGAVVQIPHRQHVITKVETPSESPKTSFLSKMEKHPSIFFLSNSENNLDLIFRSDLIEKAEQSTASAKDFALVEPGGKTEGD